MATVQRVRFLFNCHAAGVVKYAAGSHYPVTHETKSQALQGSAVLEDVEMDAAQHASELAAAIAANDALNARTIHARGAPDPLNHT